MGKRLLDEEKDAVKDTVRVQGGTRKQIIDGACIVLNIASTVTLVFLNKWCVSSRVPTNKAILISVLSRIFRDPQLKTMQISFAMWHFICTTIVLWIASKSPFRLFVPIRLPFLQMIPLCSFFAGFLILGNLSLAYNSVGFYQYALLVHSHVLDFS